MRRVFAVTVASALVVAGCSSGGTKDDNQEKPAKPDAAPIASETAAAVSSETAAATAAVTTVAPTVTAAVPDAPAVPAPDAPAVPAPDAPAPMADKPATPAPDAPAAAPEPTPGPHDFPFNPYAKASAGDWVCAVARAKYDPAPPAGALPPVSVWTWKVKDTSTATDLVLELATSPAIQDIDGTTRSWSRAKLPRLEDWLGGLQPDEITNVAITDDTRAIGGRDFACKKITVATKTDQVVIWLCRDVVANGLVALSRTTPFGKSTETLELQVAGFGTQAEPGKFGKSPADVAKEAAGDSGK
jgi:hypothetical protein